MSGGECCPPTSKYVLFSVRGGGGLYASSETSRSEAAVSFDCSQEVEFEKTTLPFTEAPNDSKLERLNGNAESPAVCLILSSDPFSQRRWLLTLLPRLA